MLLVTAFLVSLGLILLPSMGVCLFMGLRRGAFWQLLPLAVLFQFVGMGIMGSPFTLWVAVPISAWATFEILRRIQWKPQRGFERGWQLWLFAALLTADLFIIYHESGWSFQREAWIWKGISYFRPPFLHDIERDVIIINALNRGAGSPYLPDSPFAYQLFWYRWAAPIVSLFTSVSNYPFVAGCILTTAFLFFVMLLWSLTLIRPTIFKTIWGIAVVFFLTLHTDWYNGLRLFHLTNELGIETDLPSLYPLFFRNASIKSLTLIAPQHTFFLSSLFAFLYVRKMVKDPREKFLLECLLGTFCFVISPILFGFVLPALLISERLRQIKKYIVIGIFGFIAYSLVLDSSPLVLLSRPEETNLWFPIESKSWLGWLPVTWGATLGIPGVVFSIGIFFILRKKRQFLTPEFIFVFLFLLFFQFVYGHGEVRRYASLIAAALLPAIILRWVPSKFSSVGRVLFPGLLFVALLFHYEFLRSYLLKPTLLSPEVNWQDYYEMNQEIQRLFPKAKVLAGFGHVVGTEKPPVMEVAISEADPVEIAIHTRVSRVQLALLKKVHASKRFLPYGERLGYQYILWGPVEERVWGKAERDRFVGHNPPLITKGLVSLYPFEDSWKKNFKPTGENKRKLAQKATQKGWHYEAADELIDATLLDATNWRIQDDLARSFASLGFVDKANDAYLQGQILRKLNK